MSIKDAAESGVRAYLEIHGKCEEEITRLRAENAILRSQLVEGDTHHIVQGLRAQLDMGLNLLAVIHRDGGHYEAEHGFDQAVKDAQALVLAERAQLATKHEHQHGIDVCVYCAKGDLAVQQLTEAQRDVARLERLRDGMQAEVHRLDQEVERLRARLKEQYEIEAALTAQLAEGQK